MQLVFDMLATFLAAALLYWIYLWPRPDEEDVDVDR